jgi:hypothetical protein
MFEIDIGVIRGETALAVEQAHRATRSRLEECLCRSGVPWRTLMLHLLRAQGTANTTQGPTHHLSAPAVGGAHCKARHSARRQYT